MLRRVLVIAAIAAVSLLLMFVQNKIWTGTQDLHGELALSSTTAQASTYRLVLRDAADKPAGSHDWERIQPLLAEAMGEHPNKDQRSVPYRAEMAGDGAINLQVASNDISEYELGQRLLLRPFRVPGQPRPLLHVTQGIDIQGGAEFVCRLVRQETGEEAAPDENTINILRARLDQNGLGEQQVARSGNYIRIIIPGGNAADAARTRRIIESSGQLQFREVLAFLDRSQVVPIPGTNSWTFAPDVPKGRGDRVFPKEPEPGRAPTAWLRVGGVELEGSDVRNASSEVDDKGSPAIGIEFTTQGGFKNLAFTTRLHRSRAEGKGTGTMAIIFNDVVKSDPVVISPSQQRCQITGRFSPDEIASMQAALRGGSLTVKPQVLSERVLGATLGQQEVDRAIKALIASLTFVVAFMIVYYRRLGLVATGTVIATAALTWVTMVIFGATITLPGLAGVLLSLVMSLDNNVLIYERIREELAAKKGLIPAIAAGYERAFTTVIDTHITTIIAGLVLYLVGTGPVKGFGLTLMIGIAISLFTSIYLGRLLTDWLFAGRTTVSMASWFKETRLPYVAWRKMSYVFTIATVIAGFGYFAFGHRLTGGTIERNFGLDFTGGVFVQANFTKPMDQPTVDAALKSAAASATAGGLLGRELIAQAYHATALETGPSRQWLFKTRDDVGTQLERERQNIERELSEQVHLRELALSQNPPDNVTAKRIRDVTMKEIQLRLERKSQAVQSRTQAFKDALRYAFGSDAIAADGSELLAVEWRDQTALATVATLGPVDQALTDALSKKLTAAVNAPVTVIARTPEDLKGAYGFTIQANLPEVRPESDASKTAVGLAHQIESRLLSARAAASTAPSPIVRGQALAIERLISESDKIIAAQNAGTKTAIATPFPTSEQFSGQVADRLKLAAVLAIAIALALMLVYIAVRFELAFGIGAVISLAHVTIQIIGLLALLGERIDLTIIAAILTVIGYAINDTIIIYDRIRENLVKMSGQAMEAVIDMSIAQTMPRTILTAGGVVVALIIMYFITGESLKGFTITLLAGIILGTYSSVFVASPLLLVFRRRITADIAAQVAAEAAKAEAAAQASRVTIEPPTATP